MFSFLTMFNSEHSDYTELKNFLCQLMEKDDSKEAIISLIREADGRNQALQKQLRDMETRMEAKILALTQRIDHLRGRLSKD
jgi:hypothetical protein